LSVAVCASDPPSPLPPMAPTVPVNIITGFLGSGKTTLLRHVLEHGLAGRRVAVVVNEIGEIGIDGRLIEGLDSVDQMVELTSGCICCSPGLQFGLAVQEILETTKPELLVIETTGSARVAPLTEEIASLGLRLDAVTCVIDVEHVERHLAASSAAREQVAEADFLVLNKCDLVSSRQLEKVTRNLVRINRRAVRYQTQFGRLDYDLLFATAGRTYRERTVDTSGAAHLAEDEIESFLYESQHPFRGHERLCRALVGLPHDVYRVKGIALVDGESTLRLVNATCGRVSLDIAPASLTGARATNLVVIGRGVVTSHRSAIERRLNRATSPPGRQRRSRRRGPGARVTGGKR